MYDDLILRLRDAAKMSDALFVLLPNSDGNAVAKLYRDAADAIEELSKRVPKKPHGRLIDADALREDWLENGENEYVYDTNAFLDSLDDAPTIIPASEEGE